MLDIISFVLVATNGMLEVMLYLYFQSCVENGQTSSNFSNIDVGNACTYRKSSSIHYTVQVYYQIVDRKLMITTDG